MNATEMSPLLWPALKLRHYVPRLQQKQNEATLIVQRTSKKDAHCESFNQTVL